MDMKFYMRSILAVFICWARYLDFLHLIAADIAVTKGVYSVFVDPFAWLER